MSEYLPPIEIASNDPICCATSLQGTVVGILFEKTGKEIKEAIAKRIVNVENKISEYRELIKGALEFVAQKEKDSEELNKIYTDRNDGKKQKLTPYRKQIKEINIQIENIVHDYDKETNDIVGKKAIIFEKDFDKYEKQFQEIDAMLKKLRQEEEENFRRNISRRSSCSNEPHFNSSSKSSSANNIFTLSPSLLETEEDKALARLETIKNLLDEWKYKIEHINVKIIDLKNEIRRLTLIQNHINEDRQYKLDINKLSAFGFEDINISKSA